MLRRVVAVIAISIALAVLISSFAVTSAKAPQYPGSTPNPTPATQLVSGS
jgi:FlaG/FlaF family flagellin (archaellin)